MVSVHPVLRLAVPLLQPELHHVLTLYEALLCEDHVERDGRLTQQSLTVGQDADTVLESIYLRGLAKLRQDLRVGSSPGMPWKPSIEVEARSWAMTRRPSSAGPDTRRMTAIGPVLMGLSRELSASLARRGFPG